MLSIVCATSRLADGQSQVVDENGISSRNLFADRVGLGEHSESRIGGYAETRTTRGKRDRARDETRGALLAANHNMMRRRLHTVNLYG